MTLCSFVWDRFYPDVGFCHAQISLSESGVPILLAWRQTGMMSIWPVHFSTGCAGFLAWRSALRRFHGQDRTDKAVAIGGRRMPHNEKLQEQCKAIGQRNFP
jgi:hypothetical protein